MFLDTHSRDAMEQSICEFLNVTPEQLAELFVGAGNAAQNEVFFDGDKFSEVILDFIYKNKPDNAIDEILFFHLGRRLETALDSVQGYNLAELLTAQNAFSDFLKKYNIEFVKGNEHIDLYYKGEEVSLERTWESHVPYLRSRLGYIKGREDFCFNGFAFKDLLYKNDYARSLYGVPEFIGVLAEYLRCGKLASDYFAHSHYYCYEYRVPLERVLFDDNDSMSQGRKETYLLEKILQRLYEYSVRDTRYMWDDDNPILRLADDDIMEAKFFVAKEEITNEMLK